jgi:hypothetical protein
LITAEKVGKFGEMKGDRASTDSKVMKNLGG